MAKPSDPEPSFETAQEEIAESSGVVETKNQNLTQSLKTF